MFQKEGYKPNFEKTEQSDQTELGRRLKDIKDDQELVNELEKLRGSGEINDLSPSEQRDVIDRVVAWYSENLTQGKVDGFHGAIMVNGLFMPSRRSYKEKDILDEYAGMMPEIWLQYPEAARELSNLLDQDAQVINPDVYLESLGKIFRQPGLPPDALTGAVAGLSYQTSFGLMPFLEKRMDNLDELEVEQASSLLSVLNATSSYGENFGFSEQSAEEMESMLEEFPEKTNSALLKRKAEAILEQRSSGGGLRFDVDDIRDWMTNDRDTFDYINEDRIEEMSDDELYDEFEYVFNQTAPIFREYLIDQKRVKMEAPYGTDQIDINGLQRSNVGVVPVSKEYYGVYDLNGKLIGMLNKEDEKEVYQAEEMIHFGDLPMVGISDDLNSEQREYRMQAQRDYSMLLDNNLLGGLEKDYGFSVRELSTREQIWFMASLREISPKEEKEIIEFTKKYGLDGARTFLSCEYGDEFRDTVLKIGERMDRETAELVFARYGEVVQAAQNVVSEIEGYLGSSAKEQLDPTKLEQKLLEKAKDFLVDVSAQDSKRLDDKLKSFTADVQLFGNIFRSLFKGKENPDLSMVKNVEVVSREAQEIDQKDQTAMLDIADKNWQEIPRMHDFVVGLLKKSVENPKEGSEFKIMKKDNDVLAFMRVDKGEDGSAHIGSVNVNPKYRGSAIGEVMLNQAVEQLAADHVVKLEAYPGSLITVAYCEKFGFVVDGVHEIPVGGESPLYGFNMKRDDKANQKYAARAEQMTPDKLAELAQKPNEAKKIGLEIKKFDLRNAYDQMVSKIDQETKEGDVASRLFADPTDPDSRVAVFEKAG